MTAPRAHLPDHSGVEPMNEGVGPGQPSALGTGGHRRRWLPFWVMQATEIVVALVFADISVHVAHGGLLVGGAIALLALAVTAQGPLGVFRICGQRLHLFLAMGLSVVVALALFVPALRPDIEGIIVVAFGAVGLFRVATLTPTGDGHGAVGSGRSGRSSVVDAAANVVPYRRSPGAGAGAPGAGAGAGAGVGAAPGAGAGAGAGVGATDRPSGGPNSAGAAAQMGGSGRWCGGRFGETGGGRVSARGRGTGRAPDPGIEPDSTDACPRGSRLPKTPPAERHPIDTPAVPDRRIPTH